MKSLRILVALCLAALLAPAARADGLIVIRDRNVPVPRGHYSFAPLEVRYHHVNITIQDQVCTTEVDQSFYNPNDMRLEGDYIFPMPAGANIDKFTMDINGKQVEAELLDAGKARKIYEDIVRSMRDPALLEYAGRGMFKVRVFPIEPRAEKRITLKYTEVLKNDGGLIAYTYPLNTEKFSAQPIKNVSVKAEIASKSPIKSVYSPTHSVEVKRHGDDRATVGFETNNNRPDADFQLYYSVTQKDDVGLSLLTFNDGTSDPSGGGGGGYFMLLASPGAGAQTKATEVMKKDVVFVLDTSGSMSENGKLDQAKKALRFCVHNLNEGDRFQLIRFSTESESLFNGLVDASKDNRDKAEAFIKDLKPIGGTAIDDALAEAVKSARNRADKDRPYVVIFLTDGRPTVGETNEDRILDDLKKAMGDAQVRVFCFGIGTDINTHLLDKITEKTKAYSTYVLPAEDIEVKVSSFYAKIAHPVLANLALSTTGNVKISKVYPAPLPDLFKGEQLIVLGRYTGDGDAAIQLTGTVNGKERKITYEGKFASPQKVYEKTFIPKLWATRRVGYLLDEIRLHGESGELRDEVTQLARTYGIVTPYTAYLIVEDESRRGIAPTASAMPTLRTDDAARHQLSAAGGRLREEKGGAEGVASARSSLALKDAGHADAAKQAYDQNATGWGMAAPSAPAAQPGGPVGAGGGGGGRRGGDGGVWAGATVNGPVSQAGQKAADALDRAQHESRFVGGRTFYQNGKAWVDSQIAGRPQAKHVQLKFGSDDYFTFLQQHPEAQPYVALGTNVQVLVADTVYEIVDEG